MQRDGRLDAQLYKSWFIRKQRRNFWVSFEARVRHDADTLRKVSNHTDEPGAIALGRINAFKNRFLELDWETKSASLGIIK